MGLQQEISSRTGTTSCNFEFHHLSLTWHPCREEDIVNMLHSKGCFLVYSEMHKHEFCMPCLSCRLHEKVWFKKCMLFSVMVQNKNDSLMKLRKVKCSFFFNQMVMCNASHILCHWSSCHLQLLPIFFNNKALHHLWKKGILSAVLAFVTQVCVTSN